MISSSYFDVTVSSMNNIVDKFPLITSGGGCNYSTR